jgi:hypothetical protein
MIKRISSNPKIKKSESGFTGLKDEQDDTRIK